MDALTEDHKARLRAEFGALVNGGALAQQHWCAALTPAELIYVQGWVYGAMATRATDALGTLAAAARHGEAAMAALADALRAVQATEPEGFPDPHLINRLWGRHGD